VSDGRFTLEEARALAAEVLCRWHTSPGNAALVAKALVAAEADGLKRHGRSAFPSYAAQARAGKVDGFATPKSNACARRSPPSTPQTALPIRPGGGPQ
jgi:(2R)-3-sulfolactate dehydrogenase (NADP+)